MKGALGGRATLAAILLMVLNDHVLKGSGLLPGQVTGKLSDFAFLFFAPILVVWATRARSRAAVAAAFGFPSALFVAINVSEAASDAFARALGMFVSSTHVCDVEDLIALAILPLSWRYLWRRAPRREAEVERLPRAYRQVFAVMVAAIGCVATSAKPPEPVPPPPTHRAIYMSWEELRSTAVEVKEPQAIANRGKLLISGEYLFLSDPGKGVHIFDDADPKNPRALSFIQIPGNIDIAVRDGHLYADSFVDLLVFELNLPNRPRLVERLKDQFEYDPYQVLASDTPVVLDTFDKSKGVVIRLEPLQPSAQVAE